MPMIGDKEKDKKGFSGLSDLASEVSGIDGLIKPEPKTEAKPATPKQPPQPQRKAAPSGPERKTTSSPPPIETVSSGKSGGGSGGKWILGIIGVAFMIWVIYNAGQSNKKPSYTAPSSSESYSYPESTPAPAAQTPSTTQSTRLQYTKPSVGTNNLLSVPEIRWCIREGIRIEAMRDVVDNNAAIDEFNRIVNDYNNRCGSYRYREGSQSRAERDVEAYRSQIVAEAIREARQLGRSYQPSDPSASPGVSTSTAPKKPNAQYTREAQQLLTDLGYDPGPVDGDYGRRTADGVKAFQRDAGITEDGWIDQYLLAVLRRVANQRANSLPRVESRPAQETRRSSGIPANAHIDYTGRNWECDRGFRQVGNECRRIRMPANSHIDYTGRDWECDRGFRQVNNECVKLNVPLYAHIDYTGRNWECDRGYVQDGNKCVQFRVPQNAHVDYTGRNWECDRGYRSEGGECKKFHVPRNAHVDYTGRSWECDHGYQKLGNECVSFVR
ncbi:MAG: peptidoglycan-binding protein [Thiohalocapsa sp.]|nr:peptidoglycan-binding protein [Thiohalocapsa sp.]